MHGSDLGWKSLGKGIFKKYFALWFVLWILFVLYPNPGSLFISLKRILSFEVNPEGLEPIADSLPPDPVGIEKEVLKLIPYRYDWEVYHVPWYFPTIEEVLEKGIGDCKARALVLASILEVKNIPYQIKSSPIHIWIDYEGRKESSISNEKVVFYQLDPETEERFFRFPDIPLTEVVYSFFQGFWIPMPKLRKTILILGLLALTLGRVFCRGIIRKENASKNF
jgi:hypothetical protein